MIFVTDRFYLFHLNGYNAPSVLNNQFMMYSGHRPGLYLHYFLCKAADTKTVRDSY